MFGRYVGGTVWGLSRTLLLGQLTYAGLEIGKNILSHLLSGVDVGGRGRQNVVTVTTFLAARVAMLVAFATESDQCQISPAASPAILHHTVRRTWLFIAYSDER